MKFFKFWLPLIIWVGIIFYMSSLTSAALPVRWLDDFLSYAAHFFIYLILGIFSFRAFSATFPGQGSRNFLYAASFGALYAISDEFHQKFVYTRCCSKWDFLVDLLGIISGLFLVFLWKKWRHA